jgi:DNA polymerase I
MSDENKQKSFSKRERNKFRNMETSMLVSATYEKEKNAAVLKFYNPKTQKLILWSDETEHYPYCYSRLLDDELPSHIVEREDIRDIETVQKYDLIKDKEINMSKIIGNNPLTIGGTVGNSVRDQIETWESDIKYYETYLYDKKLIVGKYYKIIEGEIKQVEQEISDEVKIALKSLLWDKVDSDSMVDAEQFKKFISEWADLLNQPIPKLKRLSVDIEVEAVVGRIPDPKVAEKKVTAIGLKGTDGFDKIFVLKTEGTEKGTNELGNIEPKFYELDDEKKMIQDAFDIIKEFPFVITYNGDEFDLPYLYNRADRLGIKKSENPIYMMRNSATLKEGVHLDLYRTFSNRAFQIYVFSQKYTNFSLNSVSKALLGKEKIDYGLEFDQLTLNQTANYCYNDALLTYELTSFNNDLLMNMLVIIARIGRMPIDDIARMGVSQWIRSLFYYEHRKRNCLIPKREELERRSEGVMSDAVIKDKKFRGGLVIDPKKGIHFDVVVMDFASLYPSIIKVRNISYETVRCPHEECKKNTIPQTNHWACSKKNGLTSMIIGSLRDLRVNYYKSLAKKETLTEEQRQQYTVVSQALKVILNASYGVMGAEIFPLYFLPAAEATTAIGRHTILETIKKCEETGIEVLYGDTDSLFIKKPTEEQIKQVIEQAKKDHGVDLEIDKTYRYCVLSNRKKNYFGVTKDGKVDVKGLTGKKSHTPPFIKKLFYELLDVLSKVQTMDDFKNAKKEISEKIAICGKKVESKEIPIADLTFNVMLSKAISEYTKTIPQHVRAAKQLETIREIKKGDIISYIKIQNKPGVKPAEMAKKEEIDSKKYMEFLESTLEQITSSMDLDFDTILGKPKQTGLDEFIEELF